MSNEKSYEVIEEHEIGEYCGFHPESVHMEEADDEYRYGIRADHFVVIKGYHELNDADTLVIANHKGQLMARLLKAEA